MIVDLRLFQSHTQPSEGKSNHGPGFKAIPQENQNFCIEVWKDKLCTAQLLLSAALLSFPSLIPLLILLERKIRLKATEPSLIITDVPIPQL